MQRDKADEQLNDFKKSRKSKAETLTNTTGSPIGDKLNTITAGPRGPVLLQDVVFLEEMAHFDRERIPERAAHAKGGGAFGHFEVTHDISKYCKSKIFSRVGKKTPVAVRFSTAALESGSADTVRDLRGFAVKFYTEEGNWDLVANNAPIFFIRDPLLFPSLTHSNKRNPVTNLLDYDLFWDFRSLRPETIHLVSFIFSDRGIPDGFRHMDGFACHAFKMVNVQEKTIFCKFHIKTDLGVKNLSVKQAHELTASDPDYAIRDLYNAIAAGQFPTYTLHIQIMTLEQAETWNFNPFDVTKIWPEGEFPLMPVGKIVLNRNPKNYFADIEQMAFTPANLIPGIEPSPDKVLQGRLFAYADAHRHRLGPNFMKIPVNCPYRAKVRNYERDGFMTVTDNQDGAPNYYPNSFLGPVEDPTATEPSFPITGGGYRHNSADEDNFTQTGTFYNTILNAAERTRLVENIVNHLSHAQEFIQERMIKNFSKASEEYGRRVKEGLELLKPNTMQESNTQLFDL